MSGEVLLKDIEDREAEAAPRVDGLVEGFLAGGRG
jgi:hypothetical protein